MRIASNSLMSICVTCVRAYFPVSSCDRSFVCCLDVREVCLDWLALGRHVGDELVRGHGHLAILVQALGALLELLRGWLACGDPERARREVDTELLGGPQQLVLLLAD